MKIEYLEEFEELQEKGTFRGQQWFGERQHLVEKYSWAVPNEEVITYLSEFDEMYEAGAGSGYWAYVLEQQGVDVTAFDNLLPAETWTTVYEKDARDMADYMRNEPVLLVWPPYSGNMSYQVANEGPSHILYVGEPRGGCTGRADFFNIIDEQYGLVGKIELPSYAGVNDDFYHYVRKV